MPRGPMEASSSRRGPAPPEIRPNLIALVSLSHTLCEAGRVHEAEELCRLVLKEQPSLAIAQAALGRALYEAGKADEAETVLERTLLQTPGCFAAHRWLAEALVQRGSWDRAHEVLTHAAALAPENPRVRQLLQTLPVPTRTTSSGHPSDGAPPAPRATPKPARTSEYPATVDDGPLFIEGEALGADDLMNLTTLPNVGVPSFAQAQATTAAPDRSRWKTSRLSVLAHPLRDRARGLWQRRRTLGAIAGVTLVLSFAVGAALWRRAAPARGSRAPALRASTLDPTRTAEPPGGGEAARIRHQLDNAIAAGDLRALLAASLQVTPHLGVPEVASARLFASALLATEYGVRPAVDTPIVLRHLLELAPAGRLRDEVAAARLLLALAAGDLQTRALAVPTAAQSPWLAYARAKALRLAGAASPIEGGPLGPAIVLEAETLIDAGEPARAQKLLEALLERVPAQTRARLALAEARATNARAASAKDEDELRGACALDAARSSVVDGACRLLGALEARRRGDRTAARTQALQVAALSPPEPRLLAQTAQLLLNLGETRHAEELVARARVYASPGYPPLAWATRGLTINRGEPVMESEAPPVGGPETRLLAVRAALARGGAAGVRDSLRGLSPEQVSADLDLAWFATLSRIQKRSAAVRLAQQFRKPAAKPPGPVGSYVLGLLARWGNRRHLAAYWLRQARAGHGDACGAASLLASTRSAIDHRAARASRSLDCLPTQHPR